LLKITFLSPVKNDEMLLRPFWHNTVETVLQQPMTEAEKEAVEHAQIISTQFQFDHCHQHNNNNNN